MPGALAVATQSGSRAFRRRFRLARRLENGAQQGISVRKRFRRWRYLVEMVAESLVEGSRGTCEQQGPEVFWPKIVGVSRCLWLMTGCFEEGMDGVESGYE